VAPQKSQQPEKSAAEFLADFYKIGRKVAELFLNCVIDIKALIIGRNRLSNALMNSNFLILFWPEAFEKPPLRKDNVCGRIFLLAAEIFGGFCRKHLPGVGNTVYFTVDLQVTSNEFQHQRECVQPMINGPYKGKSVCFLIIFYSCHEMIHQLGHKVPCPNP
jgi:hypothetical protein